MKRDFKVKKKTFLIIFKGLPVAKNCLRPESAPLKVLPKTKSAADIFHLTSLLAMF